MAVEDPTAERWLPIAGYEGLYEVSDHGRVRSLAHVVHRGGTRAGTIHWKGRILRLHCGGKYVTVALCSSGKAKTHQVHTLVLTAFNRPPNDNEECDHQDFNRGNNKLPNLRWLTHHGNVAHSTTNGRIPSGERSAAAKLTERQVVRIRERVLAGETQRSVAAEYGITQQHVHRLATRKRWAHLA